MKRKFRLFINRLSNLPLLIRKLIIICMDILLINNSLTLSKWLLEGVDFEVYQINNKFFWQVSLVLIFFNIFNRQYNQILRYFRANNIYKTFILNVSFILILYFVNLILKFNFFIFKFWLIFFVIYTLTSILLRITLSYFLIKNSNPLSAKVTKLIIYGAGAAGAQLAASLEIDPNFELVCFIDDDENKQGRRLEQVPILSPTNLSKNNLEFDQLLLAIPSLKHRRRVEIIKSMQMIGINIKIIPSHYDLTSGRAKINNIREINIEDLVCRDVVNPDCELLQRSINNRNVCVTGAGGSIGSELCRQIANLKPKLLIMIDNNEFNLYKIDKELKQYNNDGIAFYSILGDCSDPKLINKTFSRFSLNVVFHAAAYKHVPLVEDNPIVGLKNNIFSTYEICKAALNYSVDSVLLVSSDKAVRPTNIMGASKRFSEMIVQAFSSKFKNKSLFKTSFSMVRFGNVLNSSGSVVPVFREQIKEGGPITITHPDIERYFMTIKEAVELMLQALSMSQGSDLFLLDMGKPIKIKTLAEEMIRLSGLTILDKDKNDGDIEIIFTGLRPGEKLYEELLIDAESHKTNHPLIYRANERSFEIEEFFFKFDELKEAIKKNDDTKVFSILHDVIPEWTSDRFLKI